MKQMKIQENEIFIKPRDDSFKMCVMLLLVVTLLCALATTLLIMLFMSRQDEMVNDQKLIILDGRSELEKIRDWTNGEAKEKLARFVGQLQLPSDETS